MEMMPKKVKILYLVTKNDIGGAQKYINDLAENLDKAKFEIKIIHGGKTGARLLSNAFWPHFLFINDWLALLELFFTFRKERPDVVHLNSSKAGVIGAIAAKLAGTPKVVFTAHGWVFSPDSDLSSLRRKFYIWLHKIAARFQDSIINVSEYDRLLAIKHRIADPKKLITIRNGINYQNLKFLDKRTARKAISKLITNYQLPITDNDIWVGSVGRLVTEKNHETLIGAAALILNSAVKFFIIGSGFRKSDLQLLITHHQLQNRFFIIENLSPAAVYLKAFNIFALSSVKEGLPYTLLEAMAAELPIVATRVGGMTEILDPAGSEKRGLVMPPREPAELARAINYYLENPEKAEKSAKEAKKFLEGQLRLAEAVQKTEEVYLA